MKDKNKITASYLRESMPDWKKKKDPILVHYITRPISFYISAALANIGITANDVSYFSGLVAIAGALCYLFNSHMMNIIGASLVFLWLLLDCVDGNLARSVRRQPFGDFADALSSYILVGVIITAMGYAAFQEGGLIIPAGNTWIILLGAFGSSADTMMRLIYQKYRDNNRQLTDENIIPPSGDEFKDHSKVGDWKVRLNMELGIAGLFTVLIILGSIFSFLDVVVLYGFCYYGVSCLGTYVLFVRKAIKATMKYEHNIKQPEMLNLNDAHFERN